MRHHPPHHPHFALRVRAQSVRNLLFQIFEHVLRVHTLLSLDAQDGGGTRTDLLNETLIVLLWGCDMRSEHGGIRYSGWHRQRWQAVPTAFKHADGPGSSLWQWYKLFSSRPPVCLGRLPSGTGFRRLHVGDVHLDHFTSLAAKPTQYHGFVHYIGAVAGRQCPHLPPPLPDPLHTSETQSSGTRRPMSGPVSGRHSLPLVLALDKPEGRRRPIGLDAAVDYLRLHLGGSARVELVPMNESMPVCEQVAWLQAADVVITPAGGIRWESFEGILVGDTGAHPMACSCTSSDKQLKLVRSPTPFWPSALYHTL